MIFEEYYRTYRSYRKIKGEINELENKKINLSSMVDIQAIPPKDSIGGTNTKEDKLLMYTAILEEVETKLVKKKKLIKELKEQLRESEKELRESTEDLDKVYLYKYVEKLKWYQICIKIHFEKTKTYELINEVDEKLSKIRIAEKNGKI